MASISPMGSDLRFGVHIICMIFHVNVKAVISWILLETIFLAFNVAETQYTSCSHKVKW